MSYKIYKVDCRITRKSYVGITRQTVLARWGQHKSDSRYRIKTSLLRKAIRKYGAENFVVVTLSEHDTLEEGIFAEREAISSFNTLCPNGYNLTIGGDGYTYTGSRRSELTKRRIGRISAKRSIATRQKISNTLRGRKANLTPEQRQKISDRARAHRHTDETRAKIAAAKRGKKMPPLSPEKKAARKAKVSAKLKGRVYSATHRARISAARTGMKLSNEHRKNIGIASKGRVTSDETKEKIRLAILGRRNTPESIERMKVAARIRVTNQRCKPAKKCL